LVALSGFSRLALIVALGAGLALAGCGRKGPLEAPPSASAVAAPPPSAQPSLGEPEHSGLEGERAEVSPGTPTSPMRKTTPLDWLLK
jgi:predicted small lipoprotein YifL